jgi:pilus assembly protein Flp/PilA
MRKFNTVFASFISDESGQDLIEYSLVAALLSCAAIATLQSVATSITSVFTSITTQLSGAIK